MSDHTAVINMDTVGISNLGGAHAEAQFNDLVDRVVDVFNEANGALVNPYGGDVVKAKITVTFEISHKIGTSHADAKTSMKVALPSRKGTSSALMLRDGQLLIEEDTQEPLQFTKQGS